MSLRRVRTAFRRYRTLRAKLAEFRRHARLTRSEFEAERLARFRRHLAYAQRHSPYYAEVLRERGIDPATAAPGDLPVLTKKLLRERFDDIVTDRRISTAGIEEFLRGSQDARDRYLGEFRVLHTSGSSGPPACVVFSERDWVRGMAQWLRPQFRPPGSGGLRPYRVAYYGATRGHYGGVSMATPAHQGFLRRLVAVERHDVDEPLADTLRALDAQQPDLLIGYVAALKVLAEAQLAGRLAIAPRFVQGGGEAMTQADAVLLRRAFRCDVRNNYGCTEHLMMGLSTPDGERIVLYDDDFVFEVRDDHCLVTNLYNETLPLFRYRLDDRLRPVADPDPRFPWLAVEALIGRSEITLTFVNDDGVPEALLPYSLIVLLTAPNVLGFQVRADGESALTLRVRVDPAAGPEARAAALAAMHAQVRRLLDGKRMRRVAVAVEEAAALPPDPRTGKLKLVVDARAPR